MATAELDYRLIPGFPERARSFPQIRFMGSKCRLLPFAFLQHILALKIIRLQKNPNWVIVK
jgi:hypothetical protein